jgi:hypothetical protein
MDHPGLPCRPTWNRATSAFLNPHFLPCRHFSTHTLFNMSVVETTPHLRVSAKKSQPAGEIASPRIPPPADSTVEDKFFWTYTEEPHRSRRQAIIKAHPEVCESSISRRGAGRLVRWFLDPGTGPRLKSKLHCPPGHATELPGITC